MMPVQHQYYYYDMCELYWYMQGTWYVRNEYQVWYLG